MGRGLMLLHSGLIANVKLHFLIFVSFAKEYVSESGVITKSSLPYVRVSDPGVPRKKDRLNL